MAKIDTQFMTKKAEKTIPFGAAHTYIAHIREYPPGRRDTAKNTSPTKYRYIIDRRPTFYRQPTVR